MIFQILIPLESTRDKDKVHWIRFQFQMIQLKITLRKKLFKNIPFSQLLLVNKMLNLVKTLTKNKKIKTSINKTWTFKWMLLKKFKNWLIVFLDHSTCKILTLKQTKIIHQYYKLRKAKINLLLVITLILFLILDKVKIIWINLWNIHRKLFKNQSWNFLTAWKMKKI